MKGLWEDYQGQSDSEMKLSTGRKIIENICEHAGKEEIALYPAFRDIKELGDEEVAQAKAEHLEVTKDLYKLDKMKEANAEYDELLTKVR